MAKKVLEKDSRDNYSKLFALRLSTLRTKAGISAREMSLSLGCNPGYINAIENAKTFPSMDVFFDICDLLDITPSDFFKPFKINGQTDTKDKVYDQLAFLSETDLDAIFTIVRGLSR